jgi:hypothetical protein
MNTKVLLDHSVVTNSTRMQWVRQPIRTGMFAGELLGAERLPALVPHEKEEELLAIYTIGRLIREGALRAFTSMELTMERFRDYFGAKPYDALAGCDIEFASNPIERGNWCVSPLEHFVKKGGKKDGAQDTLGTSQISFFEWLCKLTPDTVERIIELRSHRNLTDFECESFRALDWFKGLAKRLRSRENLPDAFHVWTAVRNNMDAMVTLDQRLVNQIAAIGNEKSDFKIDVAVISPLQFLRKLGVSSADPFPFEHNRFYSLSEVGSP